MMRRPPKSTLLPYPTLCRSQAAPRFGHAEARVLGGDPDVAQQRRLEPGGHAPAVDRRDDGLAATAELGQAAHAAGRREDARSEEHTSELQSRQYLVCRLLLE